MLLVVDRVAVHRVVPPGLLLGDPLRICGKEFTGGFKMLKRGYCEDRNATPFQKVASATRLVRIEEIKYTDASTTSSTKINESHTHPQHSKSETATGLVAPACVPESARCRGAPKLQGRCSYRWSCADLG